VAKLIYTESYIKRAETHPDIIPQYKKTLRLLEINPFHPSLGLHKLKGKLKKLYSVSINISYRICLDFIINEDKIILVDVGKHDYIY
jgi:proteic killer suppression protein